MNRKRETKQNLNIWSCVNWKLLTETLQITVLDYCNVIKFNVLFKLYLCTDTVISLYRGKFYALCAKNSSLYREYRYIEDRYIGVLSHTFYCNFCRDSIFIVIPGISLYRGSLYRGSTVSINVKNILYVKELCNEIYSQNSNINQY